MKITKLQIDGYKNLLYKDSSKFDFSNCKNYVALIGLNGSGKSNILEAISLIFTNLYHGIKIYFNYEIGYELKDHSVMIINGKMFVDGKKKQIPKKEHQDFLPTNVITSYSGEELRMWEQIYFESYSNFFQDIKNQSLSIPKLLYINKYTWEYALVALMCSEEPKVQKFIKEVLKINDDVEVVFSIDNKNYGLYENNNALSLIKRLEELQKETGSIHIKTIKTLDINAKNNKDFTQKLFYYFFVTGMPERDENNKNSKINVDKIIKSVEIHFEGIDFKSISEGEKKLILIHTICNLLADENTLVLLDEPDAHLHIDRKKEIIDIIDQDNHFTIFTTHSPKILHCTKDENVRIIRNTAGKGLEVIFIDKMKALSEITNNEFSIVDATLAFNTKKDILLVEGKYDYRYITKALEVLKITLNFEIFPCGGDANVSSVLEILLPKLSDNQLCVTLFDDDSGGVNGSKKVKELFKNEKLPKNVKIILTPKWKGWSEKHFMIEDYFPVGFYLQKIKDELNNARSHHQISKIKKSPKEWIQDYFDSLQKFEPEDFIHFMTLFDELKAQQDIFYTTNDAQ